MTEDRKPETPGMSEASPKFVAGAEAAVEAAASTDEALCALWQECERLTQQLEGAVKETDVAFTAKKDITETETPEYGAAAAALKAAEQHQGEILSALATLETDIETMPAHTAAGVLIKLRVASPEIAGEVDLSALADLERLAGEGVTALPAGITEPEDAVVVLRQRWENVRAEREQLKHRDDDDPKHPDVIEDARLRDVQRHIEESIANTLTHTAAGVAVKLRQLQRDDEVFDGMSSWRPAAFRTALEALGRGTMPAIEDPVIALKREWDARLQRFEHETDVSDKVNDPLYDALSKAEIAIHRTPATTIAGAAIKLKLWARDHGPGDSSDWWSIPLDEFADELDWLPVASALQDLERLARTPAVVETPPAEDTALIDALAEYDRLTAIGQGLERRTDVFRPDTPEAKEATEAYQAACDKAMEAWEKVRAIPAMTPAGLLARLQATDRYMTDFGEDSIYAEDWCVIKADVQRVAGETSPSPLDGETVVRVEELANEVIDLNQGIRRLLNCDLEEIPTTGQVLTLEIDRRLARLINLLDGENEEALS